MSQPYLIVVAICLVSVVYGAKPGLLLLYRPIDVSNDCAFSGKLRYDLSFGMGMSDTITMIFRTLNEIDYACNIELVTHHERNVFLVVVIKFPTSISKNCRANGDAFSVLKKKKCIRLCDLLGSRDMFSSYFVMTVRGRIRFRFLSNSSINSDIGVFQLGHPLSMAPELLIPYLFDIRLLSKFFAAARCPKAEFYQVTATAARLQPKKKCNMRNETLCVIDKQSFCFTSGVVCDGIKNCGVSDWFDERKSDCSLPTEYLGYAPVVAVVAALVCAILAGGHVLMRCLPPLANSFFIFNANEDNRLCIDPVFKTPTRIPFEVDKTKRQSLIPVSSSSSQLTAVVDLDVVNSEVIDQPSSSLSVTDTQGLKRKSTMKSMTAKLQKTIRSVTGRGKIIRASAGDIKHEEKKGSVI